MRKKKMQGNSGGNQEHRGDEEQGSLNGSDAEENVGKADDESKSPLNK